MIGDSFLCTTLHLTPLRQSLTGQSASKGALVDPSLRQHVRQVRILLELEDWTTPLLLRRRLLSRHLSFLPEGVNIWLFLLCFPISPMGQMIHVRIIQIPCPSHDMLSGLEQLFEQQCRLKFRFLGCLSMTCILLLTTW